MPSEKSKLEQIVGIIGFMDAALTNMTPVEESQWVGIFRISPEEEQYRSFVRRLSNITTHDAMKDALEHEDPSISIVCASKLLKSVINSLDTPLIPLSFALEPFDPTGESDKAVLGALLADALLRAIAVNHPGEDCASWAAAGAQLLALLCHVSRRSITQMNEYALCVCLLPCVAGTRAIKPEDLMAEQQAIMAFQSNHRAAGRNLTRIEAFITYGRRIWGAVYDSLPTLQEDLAEIARKHQQPQAPARKRDMVLRFIANPLGTKTRPSSGEAPLTTENIRQRKPTLIQRAVSHAADRRASNQQLMVSGTSDRVANPSPRPQAVGPPVPQRAPKPQGMATEASFLNDTSVLYSPPVGNSLPAPPPPALGQQRQNSLTVSASQLPPPVPVRQASDRSDGMYSSQALPMSSARSSWQNPQTGMASAAVKTAAANSAMKRRLSKEPSHMQSYHSSSPPVPAPTSRQGSSGSVLGERAPSLGDLGRQVMQAANEEMDQGSFRSRRSDGGSGKGLNTSQLSSGQRSTITEGSNLDDSIL